MPSKQNYLWKLFCSHFRMEQLLRLLALRFLFHSPSHFPHVSQISSSWNQPKPVALELRWLSVTPTAFKIKSKLLSLASVQFSSVAQSCPTLCDPMDYSTPDLPVHCQLLEFTQTHVHWVIPSNDLILCRPLLLLPSIFPSIRVFSNDSTLCIRLPEYWRFCFNISPSNEHPGLISFRIDWLDLLAVQGTLKSLLQHHSSKASFLRCSAFSIVQLSHPYMTTGKTIALMRWTFVGSNVSAFFKIFLIFFLL